MASTGAADRDRHGHRDGCVHGAGAGAWAGIDARCDLYALGAMLYEMLTGRPPFLGDSSVAVITQHIETPPVTPSRHRSDVPSGLEALTLRLLAKVPGRTARRGGDGPHGIGGPRFTADAAPDVQDVEALRPLDRLEGGVFVGRERELGELRAGLADALSGHGRSLMLVGEAGIGKTRVARTSSRR